MTLPMSGPMTAAMINTELGLPWNAPFSINSALCRDLAGIPSGPIKFSDFYGKSGQATLVPSNMLIGFQAGDSQVPTRTGFYVKALAGLDGKYPAIGDLVPLNIPYTGGAMPTHEISWTQPHNWLIFYVPAGQERGGEVQFMTSAGDIFSLWQLPGPGSWGSTSYNGVPYRYYYFTGVTANPFVPIGQWMKVRFTPT